MQKLLLAFLILCTNNMYSQSLRQLETVLQYPFSKVSQVDIQRLDARIAVEEKNNGLNLQSAITNNDYIGFEEGSSWRISAGLNFQFFDDGLVESKNEIKSLKLEKEIKKIDLENQEKDKNYAYVYNYVIYAFNADKNNILTQKKYLLGSLINKNYNLYYNHELNYEEILFLQGLNDECDLLIKSITHIDKVFESIVSVEEIPSLDAISLPILEIDIDSIIAYNPFDYLDKITTLKQTRAENLESVNRDQRLSVYFNLHARPGTNNSNGPLYNSFGMRYTTPLNFDKQERKELLVLEKERISVFQNDIVFNHNKELLNLILDYNSKLRQYSNFNYKLKKLLEKQRVDGAIKQVSTHNVLNHRDWKIDLEILNVRYELIELKQLMYLSLLRIYNKAKLPELQPFVIEKSFDESHNRFIGKRVLKITEANANKYNDEFVISYLQKNNFQSVLWLGYEAVPKDLEVNLYKAGISIVTDVANFEHAGILEVPVKQFLSRGDLELWIAEQIRLHKTSYLFFDTIETLLQLDSKTIGD